MVKRALDWIATLAVIAAAGLYMLTVLTPRRPAYSPELGKPIALPVLMTGTSGGLVLALQTSCHFCSESKPFYQSLGNAKRRGVTLVAVLPQSESEARAYLADVGGIDQVISAQLPSIQVSGTPTLIWVDGQKIVRKVWSGKLDEARQKEVLLAIGASGSS